MKVKESKIKPKNNISFATKAYRYQNEGISFIFNKLSNEYNLYINEINRYINNDHIKSIEKSEKLSLLNIELTNSSFNDIILNSKLDNENEKIKSIIQDYYLYFITNNRSLKIKEIDLDNYCKILEIICNLQFGFNNNNKNKFTKNDLLELIIWTNDFNSELYEFLFCIEYFHSGKYFKKKNIFKEISQKKDIDIDLEVDEIKDELIGIKKGMEIILNAFNDMCIEFHDFNVIKNVIEIIPTMYHINQKYKLNCKELYFLLEIKYVLKITELLKNEENEKKIENIFTKFLRGLNSCKYLYKKNDINEDKTKYNDLLFVFMQHIGKTENDKYRYLIKILLQEYKKRYKNNKILDLLLNILKENESLLKNSQLLLHEILSQYFNGTEIDLDKISDYKTKDHFLILISSFHNSVFMEQILLEVFESKFNAHFMSYTNEINNTIKYENLTDEKVNEILKGKNLETFKKCIELLEDQNIKMSNERFLPNIVYSAYIKCYLYQFISYIFYKSEINLDLKDVENALTAGNESDFKTKERKVFEIFSFRYIITIP